MKFPTDGNLASEDGTRVPSFYMPAARIATRAVEKLLKSEERKMTKNEWINHHAERIGEALHLAGFRPYEIRETMDFVWTSAFSILAMDAHIKAHFIYQGLSYERYSPELMQAFLRECIDLRNYEELAEKEKNGLRCLERTADRAQYEELLQMLVEKSGSEEFDPDAEESAEAMESVLESVQAKAEFVDPADLVKVEHFAPDDLPGLADEDPSDAGTDIGGADPDEAADGR